ncbi:hypothetical protein PVL30_003607 [Lodderomyces elongisporus]|uniref:Zinc finger CHCC-type domain-containing protein n=1 Tax=Lodderomyces elongisporus (strain ATCC 11503 / CBS 2605 / JCM 1781 / NBRC 1676 / NRRL YB-4239) TaxID=379508 RepID=A5DZH6_LODEL|nr:uncharacterized protein PVL30_003607 [Lodderomyces elongisporus]EDK44584.1 conserved hypothetical protein [Lodderomyces elongisporus NRRL YB-4239]WLF79841.1 hypothetical protein PVL30_003607 [Lodderomyces elongisporus]
MMLRISRCKTLNLKTLTASSASRSIVSKRFESNTPSQATPTPSVAEPKASQLTKKDLQNNEFAKQAPNRETTWSQSQEERIEVISKFPYRFTQRNLEQQPRPHAAIDLIAQEPVRYLTAEQGNIAVCDGNKGSTVQGHPKVFINLDQPKPATCGYCGLRYAKEEFKELIEGESEGPQQAQQA